MTFIILGIIAIIAGVAMSLAIYDLADVGLIVAVAGIFIIILGALQPKQTIKAEATGYPTAGIVEQMQEAQDSPSSLITEVEEAEIEEVAEEPVKEIEEAAAADVNEIDLLARLITAEIGYSSYYDPIDYEQLCYLAGSVPLNRIKSDKFPQTLKEVIYQPGQYQCVENGHINRQYDDIAWEIAEELLTVGTDVDPTVVYQSEFPQGSGIYQHIKNQYFCYE